MSSLPVHHPVSSTQRFLVQSTDVLQQMRVNVSEENSNQVIWYKERFLSDNEIVEHVVHNPSNTIHWSIHRPKRGWYIRLRHPSFPPGTFIPFLPVPPSSPYYVEAALSFNSRTNAGNTPSRSSASSPSARFSKPPTTPGNPANTTTVTTSEAASPHSYPPTPTTVVASFKNVMPSAGPSSTLTSPTTPTLAPRTPQPMQITQFILAPHSIEPQVPTTESSFFSRALSVIKSNRPSHSKSFTLSRVPDSPHSPPPPYASQASIPASVDVEEAAPRPPLVPFLVHHDRTPVFTVGSFTGLIEITELEERMMGVDTSFWIAVALTYLEFLENRESYLAALSD